MILFTKIGDVQRGITMIVTTCWIQNAPYSIKRLKWYIQEQHFPYIEPLWIPYSYRWLAIGLLIRNVVEIFTEISHFMLMWKFEDLGSPTVASTVRDLG